MSNKHVNCLLMKLHLLNAEVPEANVPISGDHWTVFIIKTITDHPNHTNNN